MRIERTEHPADGAIDKVVGVDLVDVARLDRVQRRGEGAVMFGNLVVGRERVASEQSADQGGNQDREEHGGNRTVASHVDTLADNFLTSNDFWASRIPGIPLTPHNT